MGNSFAFVPLPETVLSVLFSMSKTGLALFLSDLFVAVLFLFRLLSSSVASNVPFLFALLFSLIILK